MNTERFLSQHFANDLSSALALLDKYFLVNNVQTLFDLVILFVVVKVGNLFPAVCRLCHEWVCKKESEMQDFLRYLGLLAEYLDFFEHFTKQLRHHLLKHVMVIHERFNVLILFCLNYRWQKLFK
jgi:hypothetical protein